MQVSNLSGCKCVAFKNLVEFTFVFLVISFVKIMNNRCKSKDMKKKLLLEVIFSLFAFSKPALADDNMLRRDAQAAKHLLVKC